MSVGLKRSRPEAAVDAETLRRMFDGYFYKWTIAGSVRRGKAEVGDVEHVVIPKVGFLDKLDALVPQEGLFADESLPLRKAVYQNGTHRWGERYRGVEFRGFKHELFICDHNNYGAILTIRTGPAEFSQRMVTRLKSGGIYQQRDGYVVRQDTGEMVPCRDERMFFEMCGERYTAPEDRK